MVKMAEVGPKSLSFPIAGKNEAAGAAVATVLAFEKLFSRCKLFANGRHSRL